MTTQPSNKEKTIASEVVLEGAGLHSGEKSKVVLKPADEGYGRRFVRSDVADSPELTVADLDDECAPGRTALCKDGVSVETVEHVLAAVSGLDIDNVRIEVDGPEPPAGDGSAAVFADAIDKAGTRQQDAPRMAYVIDEPIVLELDGARIMALPRSPGGNGAPLSVYSYSLAYRGSELAKGWYELPLSRDGFLAELAQARTFCMARDVEALKSMGLGRGANHQNTLVIDGAEVQGTELRFADEPVRHKVLDMVGDLALAGAPIVGKMVGFCSGHRQNWKLVKQIVKKRAEEAA